MSQRLRMCGCALLTFAAIGLTACGDDEDGRDEGQGTGPGTSVTETAPTTETETETEPDDTTEMETETGGETDAGKSPEDQPGGAGDEVPARSQALITGQAGALSPKIVRVPPFIAIRVELRSGDGAEYVLSGRGRRLKAGDGLSSVSSTYPGLRPGKRLVLDGPQGRVVVEASAEPGP